MKFWIAHPAADSEPVGFFRWLCWRYAQILGRWVGKLDNHAGRVEHRALYGYSRGDDIPF